MFVHDDKIEDEGQNSLTAAYASYAGTSTWHGIPDLFLARGSFLKLFWVVILIGSGVMLTYQLYNVIDDFTQEPHYRVSMAAVVLPNGVPFPNVTVCNFARASIKRLEEIHMDLDALSYLYGSLAQFYKTSPILEDFRRTGNLSKEDPGNETLMLKTSFHNWKNSNSNTHFDDTVKLFDFLSQTCNDTMIRCFWTGIQFDCCNHSRSIVTAYGKCYSVTPPPGDPYAAHDPPTQSVQGPGNALTLWLDPSLSDAAETTFNDYITEGLIMSIEADPVFWPSDPLILEPKSINYISVSSEMNSYAQPKIKVFGVPCRMKADFTHITGEYSISKCVMDCFMATVVKFCNCLYYLGSVGKEYRNDNNTSLCTVDDQLCYTQVLYGLTEWSLAAFRNYSNCTNFCLSPCGQNLLYKSTATRTITSERLINRTKLLGIAGAESMIQAEIYFPFVGYTLKTTAEKTSIFDLIGSIGGQMGVWAGMSIISWIQMGFYFGRLCWCRCLTDKFSRLQQRIGGHVKEEKADNSY